jgi:hypothetical protein
MNAIRNMKMTKNDLIEFLDESEKVLSFLDVFDYWHVNTTATEDKIIEKMVTTLNKKIDKCNKELKQLEQQEYKDLLEKDKIDPAVIEFRCKKAFRNFMGHMPFSNIWSE